MKRKFLLLILCVLSGSTSYGQLKTLPFATLKPPPIVFSDSVKVSTQQLRKAVEIAVKLHYCEATNRALDSVVNAQNATALTLKAENEKLHQQSNRRRRNLTVSRIINAGFAIVTTSYLYTKLLR